jgi:hypothetical protein
MHKLCTDTLIYDQLQGYPARGRCGGVRDKARDQKSISIGLL